MDDQGLQIATPGRNEDMRQGFYDRASELSLAPLWKVLHSLVPEVPSLTAVPAHFAYNQVRPYLMEACGLISTEESERRVLVLENPALRGQSRITPSLFAGFQIILPGEVAPPHRHVASALRFIMEGKGAYTSVGGERSLMNPGDFIITPSWQWHDHGNDSDGPVVWLDGLDMHIVNLFSASFRESADEFVPVVTRPEGAAMVEAGHGLLPIDFKHSSQTSPLFSYPYSATCDALFNLSRFRDPDPCHGHMMIYINPLTGSTAMPTLTTGMRLLPKGFKSEVYRSTAGTVFSVVEGTGIVAIGEKVFHYKPLDLFVAPSWCPIRFDTASESVIFSYSDRIVQEKLDIFREKRGSD